MLFRSRNLLRAIYAAALATYTIYGVWYVRDFMPSFLGHAGLGSLPPPMGTLFWVFAAGGYLTVAGPIAVLMVRPMWWGKLVMLMFCLSWLMYWPVSWAFAATRTMDAAQMSFLGVIENTFLVLALAQQVVDPSLWRPPSQWGGDYPPPRR